MGHLAVWTPRMGPDSPWLKLTASVIKMFMLIHRLGITASNQQDPEDEVNEFLGSSIEARSIDK